MTKKLGMLKIIRHYKHVFSKMEWGEENSPIFGIVDLQVPQALPQNILRNDKKDPSHCLDPFIWQIRGLFHKRLTDYGLTE